MLADSVTFKATAIQPPPNSVAALNAPSTFALKGNYPNPFNPSTTIEYSVADMCSSAKLQVYSLLGQLVHDENLNSAPGEHAFQFDAGHLAAGVYLYRIVFESASGTVLSNQHKLTLLK